MKAEDLKGKTQDELKKTLMDARKDQFNARMQRAAGQLENTTSLRAKRRDIARIKTAMNQKSVKA
jgi:large subunit ribosomal protein L29